MMLGLHNDIELIILDYITTNRDLRALCLTSKACKECAIPRLYRHINIPLWHHSARLFYQAFLLGGRDQLRHTRTLVIEHQEIANPHHGCAPEDLDRADAAAIKLAEDLRMVILMAILQLFPPDVLQDFRFVSTRCIPLMALQHLSLEQRLITRLHSSYVEDSIPKETRWCLDLFHSVRHLDLQVHWQPAVFGGFFRRLVSTPNTLESLSLTTDLCQDNCTEMHCQSSTIMVGLDSLSPAIVLPRLRELSLCGFNMDLPWLSVLRKFVDFAQLVDLRVTQSSSVSHFFAELGSDPTISKFRLKHLAIDCLNKRTVRAMEEHEPGPIDQYLDNLFEKCGKLRSLHVGWHEHWMERRAQDLLQTTLTKICNDGESLRMLAFHPHNDCSDEGEVDSLGDNLEKICKACPNLQQLGYQLSYGVLDDCLNTEEADEALDYFTHHITALRDLRTLHLRFPHELQVSRYSPNSYDRDEVAVYLVDLEKTLRYIASEIFLKLDKFQAETGFTHRLDTIVIGHLTPLRQYNGNSVPQHCFIKTESKGVGDDLPREVLSHTEPGERKYRAVRVGRAALRQARIHTEILDFDIGVQPFEQWAGRAL